MEFRNEPGRIYAKDEAGNLIAEIRFPKVAEDRAEITRTFVHPTLRGRGIANHLLEAAIAQIQADGLQVTASCSYAKRRLEEQP